MSPLALILTAISFLIIAACFCAVVDYALCGAAAKPRPNLPGSLGTLREFARPTPQKPSEPSGLGALIRDEHDQLWTRAAWGWMCLTQMLPRAQWSDFTSVSIVEADS